MKFSVLTLFPEMMQSLSESIIGRAVKNGIIQLEYINIRDFSTDKHRRVDDYPYGAGGGMVMQPQPIYDAHQFASGGKKVHTIYMSPQGKTLTQNRARELAALDSVIILCGHYEGVDERVLEKIVDEEISIGDYVLTGGELPAMVLIDCVCRHVEGVLDSSATAEAESHYNGLLEYPQYTRPPEFMGESVPEVLLSGHHANIEAWRRKESIIRTFNKRPELLENADLSEKEKLFVEELKKNIKR